MEVLDVPEPVPVLDHQILLVDTDTAAATVFSGALTEAGLSVTTVADPARARAQIANRFFSVAVFDLDAPVPGAGLKLAADCKKESPQTIVIMVTARPSFESAAAAFRAGAVDVLAKHPEAQAAARLRASVLKAVGNLKAIADREDLLAKFGEAHEEFLREMMDLFRHAMDLEDRLLLRDGGSTAYLPTLGIVDVIIADDDAGLATMLERELTSEHGWRIRHAQSGGEALDSASQTTPHILIVKEDLPDLPGGMVIKNTRSGAPDMVAWLFSPPSEEGPGKVTAMAPTHATPLIPSFTDPAQMVASLREVRDAMEKKAKERRYLHAFGKQHFDFLSRYNALKRRNIG